jgi:hypothetical protein
MTSLAPVPSETSTCANCSAPLVADQRYCLSCGHPCSPVRLAFLDVLESERQPQVNAMPVTYAANLDPAAGPAWLRRAAPLLAVVSVLLLAMIVGLLVGHWVTQSKAPASAQVIKVEGLGGAPVAAAGTSPTSTTAASTTAAPAASAKSDEASEQAEAKKEEEAEEKASVKAPPAKKLSTSDVGKLEHSTGKAHEKELNKLTTAPIEVK